MKNHADTCNPSSINTDTASYAYRTNSSCTTSCTASDAHGANPSTICSPNKSGSAYSRAVIVGGADIADYSRARLYLTDNDYIIYCDCGLKHMEALCRKPDLIIGDFDSHEDPKLDIETITLPHVKDDTDTAFAAKEAVRRGFGSILFLGVIGARFDHSLGNMQLLYMLDSMDVQAAILDDFSELSVIRDEAIVPDNFSYFSLMNVSGTARGIYVSGAAYNLENAELTPDFPLGVSNEVLPGQTAKIKIKEGRLLLIKVF